MMFYNLSLLHTPTYILSISSHHFEGVNSNNTPARYALVLSHRAEQPDSNRWSAYTYHPSVVITHTHRLLTSNCLTPICIIQLSIMLSW